ncbi:basic amino acid ABC transporter substrate-binding protein [Sporosarcina luteola]|uniref:basic amino acid ABC transporter substrate-binding protein n=1 Tax=Sporosarcina luteola TaxID=582850 RepID=UPI00203D61C2|nr:basic amino acid ABC transporter substrate-binding protein [Sporosarcina luteola]
MKIKTITSILVVSLIFILVACGTSDKSKVSSSNENGKKTLRVVTNAAYAPFVYMDKGEIVGFDVEFISAVAKEAGYDVKVEHVGWEPLFVEVKGKTADIGIGAITINDERKQTYDFSAAYFLSVNEILVPEGSPIKSATDLKDKVVAVSNGTTGQSAIESLYGKNNSKLKKFKDNNLAIMELKKGGADAVVADNTVVEEYVKNNPKDNLMVIADDTAFDKEFYGILFAKDSKLKDEFDQALKKMLDNGEYANLYEKWFDYKPDLEGLKE